MFSIDQNCHSLWDVIPKLHALAARGAGVTHFLEDVDAAFTAIGSSPAEGQLRLARERFHHSGGADWGAAVFYSEFLGRLPVELRQWERATGLKTKLLARRLGRSPEDLYDEFSPGDNWQLIGPSYVGDRRHHRVIGDLTVAETAPFLREILAKAREDLLRCFPEPAARQRSREWLDREEALLEDLLANRADAGLVDLYRDWAAGHLAECPTVRLDTTSRLFSLDHLPGADVLDVFLADYDLSAGLYNQAVDETQTGLRPLDTAAGELPFFATLPHDGHLARTGVFLEGGALRIGDRTWPVAPGGHLPLADLARDGVLCLAGKAAVLVTQVRAGGAGKALALPYRGSLYMPTAHRLAEKLKNADLLTGPVRPIVRVRFRLLDRMRELDTLIRLPDHLARQAGRAEAPARWLGENHADLAAAARERLARFESDPGRSAWQEANCRALLEESTDCDRRRRELARTDPKGEQIRHLSHRIRELETALLDATLRQIADDWHTAELDYWDSRGALLPWCVALGGRAFYDHVVRQAEIYEEPAAEPGLR